MKSFKKVPAIEKAVAILDLLAREKKPLSLADISNRLGFNKSTVFNIIYTLVEQNLMERVSPNSYQLGFRLHLLGRSAGKGSVLINAIHPFLEEINQKTLLSAFLGMMHGNRAIILDKVDDAFDIKIHSEVGMRLPLLAGAGGRALLSLLKDEEIEEILQKNQLKKFTPMSVTDKELYTDLIKEVRKEGIAIDMEEYIEGIRALSIPIRTQIVKSPLAIWAVGLKAQIPEERILELKAYLIQVKERIEERLNL